METNLKLIEPADADQLLKENENALLIDVRTPQEFNYGHVPGSINVPLGTFTPESIKNQLSVNEATPLFLICQSGGRSDAAGHQLIQGGFTDVTNIIGGTANWSYLGLPLAA